ncbi:MAG: spore germination protein [Marinisporobacter sp.]|jgi:spore germination protein|nr:spore germination protein [Marinisporobacter sp.]
MFKGFKKKNKTIHSTNQSHTPNTPLVRSLDSNIESIKHLIGHSPDVVMHSFKMGSSGKAAILVYIKGLVNEKTIYEQIIKSIMLELPKIEALADPGSKEEKMKDAVLMITQSKEVQTLEECIEYVLAGDSALFIEGSNEALVFSTQGWEKRTPEEPPSEPTIRGPRDGFIETIYENIVLLRRRIRDPNFTIIEYKMGRRTKAELMIVYIKGIANQQLVDEVKRRIERIDIDAVIATGYVEQLIEDNFLSPFPQIIATERPDKVVGALMEGRVGILLDNTPYALIVPVTFPMFMQTPEDYYERWMYSSFIRLLRYLTISVALFLPAFYVALISFNQGLLPTQLTVSIAATREGVPFPSFVEALIMEITLEILREAGVRLPKPIGQAIGIVGGLVIGEAAVQAGIVSPIMVIVVALTGVSSFAIPQYSLGIAIRVLRFFMMILAGTLGLYGIMLGFIIITVHMVKLKSFDTNYTAPFVPYRSKDWKDFIIRMPMMNMKQRPEMMKTQDKQRKS